MMTIHNKPEIIMPFTLPWDWSADYQRQTCLELAKRGHKITAYMYNDAHFFLKKHMSTFPKHKNISFHIPKYVIPFRRIPIIKKINDILSLVIFATTKLFRKKIIWICNPQFYNFGMYFDNCTILYDCVDYTEIGQEKNEKKLIESADFFFVNSHTLYKLHKNKRNSIHLVPQGFNFCEFKKFATYPERRGSKNNIGFIGGINYRLDFKILHPLVKNNPQWNFLFWGQLQKEAEDILYKTWTHVSELKKNKNVTFDKTTNKKTLVSAIERFDVCIIPYDVAQQFNKNCYPMKIFEFFYLGKPVVSTPITELKNKRFDGLVYTANSYKKFEKQIKTVLEQPWPKTKKRQQIQFAQKNSWERKIDTILRYLNQNQ